MFVFNTFFIFRSFYFCPVARYYLQTHFPENFYEIIRTYFQDITIEAQDHSEILIAGGGYGLRTIYEAALVLTKTGGLWFAFIDCKKEKKQLVIVSPQNKTIKDMPHLLQEWLAVYRKYTEIKEDRFESFLP